MIETLSLFPDLNQELIYFLADLKAEEWRLKTSVADRTVKDLAAHILDGSMRRLSIQRDHYLNSEFQSHFASNEELVEAIQQLNRSWMLAFQRISPRLLIELLKKYEQEVYELFTRLKNEDEAVFAVSWAGEQVSANWFDIARDYTEKWHHQQQMRLTTNRPMLLSERFIEPVYDTFMMGMPFHLQQSAQLNSSEGDHLLVEITGEARLKYSFVYRQQTWQRSEMPPSKPPTAHVVIPAALGWQFYTNTFRNKSDYFHLIKMNGNQSLCEASMYLVTVLS